MEIRVLAGDVTQTRAGAVMVGIFEGTEALADHLTAVDKALEGAISRLVEQGEIKGKLGEITLVHSLGRLPSDRVVVAGLGKKQELTKDRLRGVVAEAARLLQRKSVETMATGLLGAGIAGIAPEGAAQAITEGALLGTYSFRKHITKEAEHGDLKQLLIVTADEADRPILEPGCHRGRVIAEAVNFARDMVNEPANYMAPGDMAEAAKKLAQGYGLGLTVLEKDRMQELGMGALLGVSQGSCQPPRFIVLDYKGGDSGVVDLALVGKGITFDSGGISIKPSEKMEEMKTDMAGGAAVMAAMAAIAQLKPRINVTALVPAVENLPSGSALRPGDIVTAMTGKTIEIISTDAEGRLILADALGYAVKLGARFIVDVATLTGAIRIALGAVCSGAFGNNQGLVDKVLAAGAEAGEPIWQMPMYDDYKEQNKSDVADIKNVGGRLAGAITAAQFLAEFVGDTPWLHLDIAGTSTTDKERHHLVKGATGVAVATLVNLALSISAESTR